MEKWEELIKDCTEKECHNYSFIFFKHIPDPKDEEKEKVLRLLGDVTSMYFKLDTPNEPFGPMSQFGGKRSAIPDDFADEQLQVFSTMVPNISDADMRARIADVLWLRKRNHHMAGIAVTSYLESATILEDPDKWTACEKRIERALQIAVSLGKSNTYFDKVISHIETILDKYNGQDSLFLSAKLMGLLLEYKKGDPKKYASLSEKIAKRAESEKDWHRANTYWGIKARWFRLVKDAPGVKDSLIQAAETYVKLAEMRVSGSDPSYLAASSFIQNAIEAYRKIGGMNKRIDELNKILLDYQKKSRGEMKAITTEVNLNSKEMKDAVQKYIARIKGKKLHDSIFELAKMASIPKVIELREEVKKLAKDYPLQYIIDSVEVNEAGKVTGRTPGILSDAAEEQDAAMRAHMFKQAHFHYETEAFFILEPVRRQIISDHNIRTRDFLPLVSNNPFVPEGREHIFAQGLNAGMEGNFMLATHLLIPQFENSIRYILANSGGLTSGIDDEGIQNEYNLNKTLYLPKIKEIFGEDIIFTLQGILVEHNGSNLRNRMAHGLMSLAHFYSSEVEYFWWLMLRFVCWHILVAINKKNAETEAKPNS